jgi:catechol 2,3-dioxygenase-like lactoylglutathione lyase family enzyme
VNTSDLSSTLALTGLHHVTAVAGDPRRNVDFYTRVLGLRLIKRTVNFDDPSTYHLYYGDSVGTPGSVLTFFPWAGIRRGRPGHGQAYATAFSVPAGSLDFWAARLRAHGVAPATPIVRFGDEVLAFTDPDGLESLQLVARKKNDTEALRTLPEDMSFSLSLSATRAYSSSAIHDDSADGEVLSKREGIAQLVTLTQTLPARGTRAAGTLVTTGYISHGLVYDKVTVGEEKTATAVNVPTAASFRATGTYDANSDSDSEDGLAEVLITLGSPVLQAAEADAN